MKYDKEGREMPDDTPVEVPLKFRRGAVDRVDDLKVLLERLKDDQEESAEMDFGPQEDGDIELGDLPSRYELDHEAEERALTFSRNAERMIARRKYRRSTKEQDNVRKDGIGSDRGGDVGVSQAGGSSGVKGESAGGRDKGVSGVGGEGRGGAA